MRIIDNPSLLSGTYYHRNRVTMKIPGVKPREGYTTVPKRTGEKALSIECLPLRQVDLSSDPQYSVEKTAGCTESGKPRSHWAARLGSC